MTTTTKKSRLGMGLDAVFGAMPTPTPAGREELRQIPVEQLRRGRYQPRTHMDQAALDDLASSIRTQGVVQPIVARELPEGGYEIVAGERRWRAAQLAGLTSVPAVVRKIPDEHAIAIALIENIQRENLNPVEEAGALQRLLEEFGMTHQAVAEAVGRSRAAVTNLLRLLQLEPQVRDYLDKGQMDMGHARALLALTGMRQCEVARKVVDRGMSVRQTETLVRHVADGDGRKRPGAPRLDPDVRRLMESLSGRLGARVAIMAGAKGRGRLVIEYGSLEELDGILARMGLPTEAA